MADDSKLVQDLTARYADDDDDHHHHQSHSVQDLTARYAEWL